jgi:hypothetical protein
MKWRDKDGNPVWETPLATGLPEWPGPVEAQEGAFYLWKGTVHLCRRGVTGGLWPPSEARRLPDARVAWVSSISRPVPWHSRFEGNSVRAWYLIPQESYPELTFPVQ